MQRENWRKLPQKFHDWRFEEKSLIRIPPSAMKTSYLCINNTYV
ncbi:hypothetical protein MuYL_2919 [Mucilaginibacter xinganensis]|uniref:Uncharacterized protein n=1 Tax=Mucilaginibacter xinganensis TaxID=1234841 RepID=A0A223NYA6_9SPHI|nr:hypothetical protein MuYL_2919 [Mucilaginibacter xinganensis]